VSRRRATRGQQVGRQLRERSLGVRRDAELLVARSTPPLKSNVVSSQAQRRGEKRLRGTVCRTRFGGGRDAQDEAPSAHGVDALAP